MVVGDVGTDQEHLVSLLKVVVSAGRTVAAERELVAGYRVGHAQSLVAVVVVGAKTELNELAELVGLLGHELPSAHHAACSWSVLELDFAEFSDGCFDRLVPSNLLKSASLALQQRVARPDSGRDDVMLFQSLGSELA